MGRIYKNYIKTKREPKIFYRKGTIIKKYLKDQILKREIKSTYLPKILRVSDLARN